ncbi:MAG: Quorum-sensing regulator protein F [Candidatus Accumulibacter appositus]|uniref:Quorum-sensing regulator protein F n=1 Tax=Candidatus Accumulibacter appositus TaxID=1454003 RepID=A0A011P0P1_9PROT|nr:sigma-54 dependent transcriptional regulator [Accumulibacter sp.]EXI81201.1 MAG: Quorum-sensing regulator protein F [Candidatus Accumulibacter appositus]HRF06107.1 sigma-54 dependent transcriptional regulator [Accumulibacter sp.]
MSNLPEDNGFIGESVVFREMLSILARVARYDTTVLISGETGSGKEMAARAVHYQGQRRDRPFIPVNCGALPDQLVENELFGHARGAYTDARESQLGLIAQAAGGTLFLDEVDTLTAKAQISLLRFLQDGQYRRLGCGVVEKADVRVVAACNSDLAQAVEQGAFRADLYYRLTAMELHVPPLRARGQDAVLLARHVIAEAASQYHLAVKELHADTIQWLLSYAWPGNVRELQNRIQREFLLCDEPQIRVGETAPDNDRRRQHDRRSLPANPAPLNFNEAKQQVLQAFERGQLLRLMSESAGNVSSAARLAGKERRALGKLLKKHGIAPDDFRHT